MSQENLEGAGGGAVNESFDSLAGVVLPGLVNNRGVGIASGDEEDDGDAVPASSDEEGLARSATKKQKKSTSSKKAGNRSLLTNNPNDQSASSVSSYWNSQKLKDVSVRVKRLSLKDLKDWVNNGESEMETSPPPPQPVRRNKRSTKRQLDFNVSPKMLRSKKRNLEQRNGNDATVTNNAELTKTREKRIAGSKSSAMAKGDDGDDAPVVNTYAAISNDLSLMLEDSDSDSAEENETTTTTSQNTEEVEFKRSPRRSRTKVANFSAERKTRSRNLTPSDDESSAEIFATCPNTQLDETGETFATCPEGDNFVSN